MKNQKGMKEKEERKERSKKVTSEWRKEKQKDEYRLRE